jgi:hypothetical protein
VKPVKHVSEAQKKIGVWFDRARDELCFVNRLDELCGDDPDIIPDDAVVRIPLLDAEEFVEVVMTAMLDRCGGGDDFTKVYEGIQVVLDGRATHSVQLAERFRLEMQKRSQGVVNRNMNEALVRMDALQRLRSLRDVVKKQRERIAEGEASPEECFELISDFYQTGRLDES